MDKLDDGEGKEPAEKEQLCSSQDESDLMNRRGI